MNTTRRSATALGSLVLVALLLILGVDRATDARVAHAQTRTQDRRLAEVLPAALPFDARLPGDTLNDSALEDEPFNSDGLEPPERIERRFTDGKLAALAMQVTAPDGYNGAIHLLIGLHADGRVSGVRVTEHHETPGLGDDIELRRSNWIRQFDGLSLAAMPPADWAVTPRGGRFDAFTGATLTPQAVVQRVHAALRWYAAHREAIAGAPRS